MNIPPKNPEPATHGNQQSLLQTLFRALTSEPHLELIKTLTSPVLTPLADERFRNVIAILYGNRPSQIAAAKRLAQLMVPPRLDKITKATARSRARELGMPLERYLREAIYPDALLLAASNIVRPQKAPRLGRNWLVNETGKRAVISVGETYGIEPMHWLYQEATKACRAIVMEEPYPDEDALTRAIDDEDGSYADKALTAASLQQRLTTESADRQLDKLKAQVSRKECALLIEAYRRDGDLMAVLLERGYSPKTAHKKRERWRNAVKY